MGIAIVLHGVFLGAGKETDMELELAEIEARIESALPDATAEVTQPRGPEDDDHLAATVISPAFEGETLVDQHEMVYDALEEYMTDEIHAIELQTKTPDE